MIDWVGGIEARNYGIRRVTDLPNLGDLLRIIMPIVVLAGFLYSYLWSYSQIVHLGYEEQQLQTAADALRRTQKALILEEETLKDPQRIDSIARNELNMSPLEANQIMAPANLDLEPSRPADLAMATPSSAVAEQRKPSAAN